MVTKAHRKYRLACLIIAAASLLLVFCGCSDSSDNKPALAANAGYSEIEPIRFSFQSSGLPTLNYTSSPARMMHYFFPADSSPETKPLFVFFNGGPSCATCTGLLSLNTAPYSLDKTKTGGADYILNPYSFTQLGNILYIDAANTGFSYNTAENASIEAVRKAEFDAHNFNIYTDAAQFIRLLLRFLSDNPSIMKNEVIIVGESYGGVRAQVMLNMLLFHERYNDSTRVYRDEKLADQIKSHFWKVFPQYSGQDISPETASLQFGKQVLIEPLITGCQGEVAGGMFEEPDSVIDMIARETGTVYTRCSSPDCDPEENAFDFVTDTAGREIYQYSKPAGFIDEAGAFSRSKLDKAIILSLITGTDTASIPYLSPAYRQNAYRSIKDSLSDVSMLAENPAYENLPAYAKIMLKRTKLHALEERRMNSETDGTLEEVLGMLNPWDKYIIRCNEDAFLAFFENSAIDIGYDIDPQSAAVGGYFLQNLAIVRTFITDCDLDLVIYAPAIPDSLERSTDIVNNVVWNAETDDGYIDIYYKPGSLDDVTTPYKRTIYFPRYADAGHMVSLGQPGKFLEDVKRWLGY